MPSLEDCRALMIEEAFHSNIAAEDSLRNSPHADHYKRLSPEPITVIEGWGLGFNLGNAVKYIARAPYKGSKKADLEKAIWYLQREVSRDND